MFMKIIVFDTGPIISLVMNNLLQFMDDLKEYFGGDFVITPAVKQELIERPLSGKRFAFEALRVLRHVREGTIKIIDANDASEETEYLMNLANHMYKAKGNWIKIVHIGEMEAVAYALKHNALAFVVDERTTRMLLENPDAVEVRLSKKLHVHVTVNRQNLEEFKKRTKGLKVLRSIELMVIAYEKGLLKKFVPDMVNASHKLLDAMLWSLKMSGCAISNDELKRIIKLTTPPS